MEKRLLKIINILLKKNDKDELTELKPNLSLRNDLGFDSLDLAELTVRIEDEFFVDVFEEEVIDSISEIIDKISGSE